MITNYHVIDSLVDPEYEGYARLYVRLGSSSSARIPAKVLAWDPLMDLALIQTNIKPEHVYSVFDLGTVAVGAEVLAIGSPAGLEKTVTRGIVSALGRRLLESGAVFQLDAAVNQGNSGGPAVDSTGRLVGIVFAGIPMFQGLNFALPAEKLLQALPALLKEGPVCRPWLGIATYESAKGCIFSARFMVCSSL
jgi:serine protease Do